MKVCTDSCLFGAWVADKLESKCGRENSFSPARILDIGTGTGLLALMLAQKSMAEIEAVEIEKDAFEQSSENFAASPWTRRLKAIHSDIKTYVPKEKYDFIISNPPFFENDLKSAAHHKNLAKHHEGLLLKDLLSVIKNLLTKDGKFALLLPFHRVKECISLAEKEGFFLEKTDGVKQTSAHNYFRAILLFSTEKKNLISGEITIRKEEGIYSDEFQELLENYYL